MNDKMATAELTNKYHYCPGCTHTLIHKILAKKIIKLGIQERTIGLAPVGCAVLAYNYLDIDWSEAAHGRAPAVALGIKSVHPDSVVICYQGDGDLASIGLCETIHTAARGVSILVIFINNGIYGMTGGQMAPTTMPNIITSTSPDGRNIEHHGYPLRVAEMINQLERPYLIARTHAADAENMKITEELIEEGLRNQMDNKGYSFIEILSACPTNWKMTSKQSFDFVKGQASEYFKLGVMRRNGKVI